MKRRFLVGLLVLSFVLVGCGKVDYTDVDLYKDVVVKKYEEIDKNFFKSYDDALNKVGIKNSMDNLVNASLGFIDESLDLLGDESESFYNNFKSTVNDIDELPFSEDDINEFVNEFDSLSDKRKEQVRNLTNSSLDKTASQINKVTDYIKDLSAEQVKKLKEGVKVLVDKGEDVFDAVYDYVNEQLGN